MVLKAVPIYASGQSDDLWLAAQSWTGWQVCFRPLADIETKRGECPFGSPI
jgi:hypothetical protein